MSKIITVANQASLFDFLTDRKNSRRIPHRLEACGYVPVRNPDAKDGLWKILGRRQVVYAKDTLGSRERLAAVLPLASPVRSTRSVKSVISYLYYFQFALLKASKQACA